MTKWDTNRAYHLWCAGVPRLSIATTVGCSIAALRKFAYVNGWPARKLTTGGRTVLKAKPMVTRRCPGCLGLYRTPVDSAAVHCNKTPALLSGVAA